MLNNEDTHTYEREREREREKLISIFDFIFVPSSLWLNFASFVTNERVGATSSFWANV